MPERIKNCPVISVKGNKIVLGPPGKSAPFRGQMTRAQYRKVNDYVRGFKRKHGRAPTQQELAGVWAFLVPGMLALLPIIAVAGVGIGGAYLASTAVEKMRPFLSGLIPIGITGVGLWGYGQVKPWLKPVAGEFKTEREFRTALARQKAIDTAVIVTASGGFLYGVYTWVKESKLLKERKRLISEKETTGEIPGKSPLPAEVAGMQKLSELLKTGDIVIKDPVVHLLQWWGAIWEGFTLRLELELENKSPYELPYLYLEVEDLDIGYTAVKKYIAWNITPNEITKVSAQWTATEGTHGDLPYGVPGEAHLLIRLGIAPGQYFMRREVTLVPILAPHLKVYESKREPPGVGPEPGPGATRRG